MAKEIWLRRLAVVVVALATMTAAAFPVSAAPSGDERWALIIGVDTFQGNTRPNIGAVGDARAFQELLRRDGWREDHVRVLTNAGATASAIRDGMQWLVNNCASTTSRCIFHYSGHTKQMNASGDNEVLHEFLWPHDNRFISDTEVGQYLRQLNGDAWVDISACEAAGFNHGISTPRRLFTAASQEHEKAFEFPMWSQSVWTGALVQKGMLEGGADANGDGHVTLAEAIADATITAARMTKGQSPSAQHPYVAGGEAVEWFPAPAAPAAAAPAAAAPKTCFLLIFCS